MGKRVMALLAVFCVLGIIAGGWFYAHQIDEWFWTFYVNHWANNVDLEEVVWGDSDSIAKEMAWNKLSAEYSASTTEEKMWQNGVSLARIVVYANEPYKERAWKIYSGFKWDGRPNVAIYIVGNSQVRTRYTDLAWPIYAGSLFTDSSWALYSKTPGIYKLPGITLRILFVDNVTSLDPAPKYVLAEYAAEELERRDKEMLSAAVAEAACTTTWTRPLENAWGKYSAGMTDEDLAQVAGCPNSFQSRAADILAARKKIK